jgi:hypothetical protein
VHADKDVQFDWDGSLELARKLWSFADDLSTAKPARKTDAETALRQWKGRFGDEFTTRADHEQTSFTSVITGLRNEAKQWAQAWKLAMDQQNRVLRARAVDKHNHDKSFLDKVGDFFGGDDNIPPEPTPVPLPAPPSFPKTAGFYST